MDVDDAGCAQPKLGREGAGQQAYVVRKTRAKYLAETGDAFRQLYPVYPVLKVGMVAANVELAERILDHARRLEQHLVKRGVVALRQFLNCLLAEAVNTTARLWRQAVACFIKALSNHCHTERRF